MILEGQVAIVTGAGQGVGRGVALALAAEGARVAVVGRTAAKCEAVAGEIADRGGTAVAVRCDVTTRADVDACTTAVRDAFGPIQILVNVAQTTHFGSLRKLTEDALEELWQSGPVGTLRFMQSCFDDLRRTRGSIVNFGSGSSLTAQPAMGGYAAVKEGIRVFSRVAAVEWGRHGIRVNVICPLAESPGMSGWAGDLPDAGDALVSHVPLGRLGDTEKDIGRAVVYLAGPDGGYVTGTTLMVDGGHDYLR
ncbi:MAG TPA: SDR family oxidoreductase [Amycolatopsis sp.]|nr:SDR family oxidoreductase [Amycolatopsis sp.]